MSDIRIVVDRIRAEIAADEQSLVQKREALQLLEQAESKLPGHAAADYVPDHVPDHSEAANGAQDASLNNGSAPAKAPRPKWTPERRAKTLLALARARKNAGKKKKAAK